MGFLFGKPSKVEPLPPPPEKPDKSLVGNQYAALAQQSRATTLLTSPLGVPETNKKKLLGE